MVIGKGVRMFNKKPHKAMYFPESVFFAKEDIYHTISYIIIYLINKYNMQGKYAYRTYIDENKSRVGIENNY